MDIGPLIINRLTKITGGIIKGFSYIFHFIFPNKRFIIPENSKAFKKGKETKIPKTLWQTNYTYRVTLPLYINYLFNRLMSQDWDYRYVSTEKRYEYINKYGTKRQKDAFNKLTDGAAQADFWRLFVLNREGGVYMDIDAYAVWPLSSIVDNQDEVFIRAKKGHINNYFIASKPNNDILKRALEIVVENIEQKKVDGGVYDLTGPTALNQAIDEAKREINDRYYRITAIQGSFTNEYFQYLDKKEPKWNKVKNEELLKE